MNHWRKKILQYRLVIKLADKPLNSKMLSLLAYTYGGFVRQVLDKNKQYVQWIINDKKIFFNTIVPLLEQYPPLTSRMRLQFEFFKFFLDNPDIKHYFNSRKNKYLDRDSILPLSINIPSYFKE